MKRLIMERLEKNSQQSTVVATTICIVLTFISTLLNARHLMIIMMIGLAESIIGDSDFFITKTPNNKSLLSNFIDVNSTHSKLSKVAELGGAAPRWILPGFAYNPSDPSKNASCKLVIGDSLMENNMGIGRNLKSEALGNAETIMMTSVKNMIGLTSDDFVFQLDLLSLLKSMNLFQNDPLGSDREVFREMISGKLPSNINISLSIDDVLEAIGLPANISSLISDNLTQVAEVAAQVTVGVLDRINSTMFGVQQNTDRPFESVSSLIVQIDDTIEQSLNFGFENVDPQVTNMTNWRSVMKTPTELQQLFNSRFDDFTKGFASRLPTGNVQQAINNTESPLSPLNSTAGSFNTSIDGLPIEEIPQNDNGTISQPGVKNTATEPLTIGQQFNKEFQELVKNFTSEAITNITETLPNSQEVLDAKNRSLDFANKQLLTVTTPSINVKIDQFVDMIIDIILDSLNFKTNLRAKKFIDRPAGKWPDTLGNVVFIDSRYYLNHYSSKVIGAFSQLAVKIADLVVKSSNTSANDTQPQDNSEMVQDQFNQMIQLQVKKLLIDPIVKLIQDFNLTDKAMIMFAVVRDKKAVYASFSTYKLNLVRISNEIMQKLGLKEFQLITPMFESFQALGFVAIFIQNIVYMIICLLMGICAALFVKIMIFGIEDRTYELALRRVIGSRRSQVVLMLLLQSGVDCLLGWLGGTLLSWEVSRGMDVYFYLDKRLIAATDFDSLWWIICVVFGVLMPSLINLTSIRKSLSKRITDGLDSFKRTDKAVEVVFLKLANLGVSPLLFLVSLEMFLYGFLFYYVAPYLFFMNRFDLFVYLFNFILLPTLLALVVIAHLFQGAFQSTIVYLFCLIKECRTSPDRGLWTRFKYFFTAQRPLHSMISINMKKSKNANRMTSIILSSCICFVIFAGSGIKIQIESVISQVILFNGSDLNIKTDLPTEALDEYSLRKELDLPQIKNLVQSFSFIASYLHEFPFVSQVEFSAKSLYPVLKASIIAVDSNFSKTFYGKYYSPIKYKNEKQIQAKVSTGQKDGFEPLFEQDRGSKKERLFTISNDPVGIFSGKSRINKKDVYTANVSAVVPAGIVGLLSTDVGVPSNLNVIINGKRMMVAVEVVHSAQQVPGMKFSKYKLKSQLSHDIIISMESYGALLEALELNIADDNKRWIFKGWQSSNVKLSTHGVPKNRLIIKLVDGISKQQRDQVQNLLKNKIKTTDSLTDAIELREVSADSLKYLGYLNICVAIISITICFFMLLVSMTKKLKDSKQEIGIIRSIGINISDIKFVYRTEIIAVIITSMTLGIGVGLLIAYISQQFYVIFFEIDLGIGFPLVEAVSIIVLVSAISLLTGYLSMRQFIDKQICSMIKDR